jgi:hypothetical protein
MLNNGVLPLIAIFPPLTSLKVSLIHHLIEFLTHLIVFTRHHDIPNRGLVWNGLIVIVLVASKGNHCISKSRITFHWHNFTCIGLKLKLTPR